MAKKVNHLILDATKPYQIIFCIFGIAPFPFVTEHLTYHWIFPILLQLYKFLIMGATLFQTYERCEFLVSLSSARMGSFLNGLHFAQFIVMTLIRPIMQLFVFFKCRDLELIFIEISSIEHNLMHMSSKMNRVCSRFTFSRQLLCVSGLMLLTVLFKPVLNVPEYVLVGFPLVQVLIDSFSEFTIRCKSVEFCILVQVFNELLAELVLCLNELQRKFNSTGEHCYVERLLLQKRIISIQNLQSRIWKTVNMFTDYFAVAIICLFVHNGLTITNIIYRMYVYAGSDNFVGNITNIFTLIFLFLDIFLPCYLSDTCIQTYQKIIRIIHDFKPTDTNILMKMCLREYSLQLTHQKLIFSCGGYFDINLQCFGEIVLTITTYIVILIQFKLQAEKPETS